LCELMLLRYRGIPLTRPYIPGASKFHLLWALYLSAFTTYTMTSAALERELMRTAGTTGIAWAVVIGLTVRLAIFIPYFLSGRWTRKALIEDIRGKVGTQWRITD